MLSRCLISKYNVKHLRRSAESSGGTRLEFVISAKEFKFLTQHWVDFTGWSLGIQIHKIGSRSECVKKHGKDTRVKGVLNLELPTKL